MSICSFKLLLKSESLSASATGADKPFHKFIILKNLIENFLSLHIFVQSLAEQKHALKISEHTLIKCVTTKQATIHIQKCQNEHTRTAQQSGKFGGPGQTLTWGLS
jgi:hypothetical protein